MNIIKYAAYILTLVGALNWGLIGLFDFNLVTAIFGEMTVLARIVYIIVGASAIVSAFSIRGCERYEKYATCETGNCRL